MNLIRNLFVTLHKVRINVNKEDSVAWKLSESGNFTTNHCIVCCLRESVAYSHLFGTWVFLQEWHFLDGKLHRDEF